jgi:methyl-accepting chemotaxis protein
VLERGDKVGLVGRSVSTLVERFMTVATEFATASGQLSQGSPQLAMTARILSQGANVRAASMKEVPSRISIIEEIAAQTDLLAQNAAIEVERARAVIAEGEDSR